jgi:hypothetical protein
MLHHRTYRIFPDGNISKSGGKVRDAIKYAIPGQSHHVRFCHHTYHNTCSQIDLLSRAFADAQLYKDDGGDKDVFYISIVSHPQALKKYKPQDHETSMDRIEWLIREFQAPTIKLVISIYISETMTLIESGFFTSTIWPFRRKWKLEDTEKKVSIQDAEGMGDQWKMENTTELINMTKALSNMYDYTYVMLDYTYNYEDALTSILESKIHVGYVGATHFLALGACAPTVGFGIPTREMEYEGETIKRNIMGTSQTGPAHLRQRNPDTLEVEHRPILNAYTTTNPLDILNEFYRLENIVPTKRDS